MTLRLAWRLLGRELKSGELRLLFFALSIAVAAVSTVGFFTDRVRQGLEREARQMMGGDLVLLSDHPLPESHNVQARRLGLATAQTLSFPSMILGRTGVQLADIKAVDGAYPLRGKLSIRRQSEAADRTIDEGPVAGTVWLDERLSAALGVGPGDMVSVGTLSMRVAALLTREPDRGVNFFSLAPRLMMHSADIQASGLVQFGSRVRYSLLVAGDEKSVVSFRDWLSPRLQRGERLEDVSNARPEIRSALDRASQFLALSSVLTVILSAVAVALAARRYMQRHLDACAVLCCLGMTHGVLLRLHFVLFLGLAMLAGGIGSLGGLAAHVVLVRWLAEWLAFGLPFPGLRPLADGFLVAGVLLFGFAFPPLLQLAKVPTLRVLRRELGPSQSFLLGTYAIGLALLAGLIFRMAGDARLGLLAAAGFAAALSAFWLIARLLIGAFAGLRGGIGFGWRQGLASLGRHASAGSLQVVALAIGLMAMLLLTVIHAELIDSWRRSVPEDAPNLFAINIQPDQRQAVTEFLLDRGIEADLQPMVRARLVQIGGRPVGPADYPEDERAQRLVEREFNLSWRPTLPPGNRIVAGLWFSADDTGRGLASVESGLAKTLGIRLGDELTFNVAGSERRLTVSNLRQLDWDSMRVNFFVIAPPGVIEDAPASYLTSFHLPGDRSALRAELVRHFPNLTLIDVAAILREVQSVIGQVAGAVRFVFVFALIAGGVVLYSALLAAFDERRYELSVMRALGARRRQIGRALLVELAAIGGLAGFLAALGAMMLGQGVAQQIFQIESSYNYALVPLAIGGGAAFSMAIGWLALRRLVIDPPLLVLRNGL